MEAKTKEGIKALADQVLFEVRDYVHRTFGKVDKRVDDLEKRLAELEAKQ